MASREVLALLVVLVLILGISNVESLTLSTDHAELRLQFKHCYTDYAGNNTQPRTTDSLIDLIAKVENHLKLKYYPSELSAVLLSRFRRDNIKNTQFSFKQDNFEEQKALFEIIPDIPKNMYMVINETINEDLSVAEKCALHFMLSHSYHNFLHVRTNSAPGIMRRALDALENLEPQFMKAAMSAPQSAPSIDDIEHIEESGTLYNPYGTVFGGAVLAGIAASNNLKPNLKPLIGGGIKIDRVYGATLANYMARAIMAKGTGTGLDDLFGPGGDWDNNTKCTKHYTLKGKSEMTNSYAELFGGIDGLILGLETTHAEAQGHTLSSMLRLYYGDSGEDSPFAKACSRWNNVTSDKLNEQSTGMAYRLNDDTIEPKHIPKFADDVFNYFTNNVLIALKAKSTSKKSCPKAPTVSTPACYTEAEVMIVMDATAHPELNLLASTILTDLSTNGSTIGVYSNTADLKAVAPLNGSLTKTGVVCEAQNFNHEKGSSLSLSQTVTAVNKFFSKKNKEAIEKAYLPPQIVIIMKSGSFSDGEETDKALANIDDYQPEVTIMMMGDVSSLKNLDENNRYPLSSSALKHIHNRICSVPGKLQYYHCNSNDSDKENEYQHIGQVTPKTIEYLTVLPKYFKLSSNVKITFEINNKYGVGDAVIEVTSGRGTVSTSATDKITIDKINSKHTFEFKNPCGKYDDGECKPISFSIVGVSCNAPHGYCCKDKDHCMAPNQIQFRVTHEGFYCGSAWSVAASSLLMLLSPLAVLISNKYAL